MKYLVVSFILFMCTLQTFCQQEYFVYLQTDNNQAFYVRLNNKVYSSTASGYLLLTNVGDSPFAITIGFAKNVSPEQQFNISANHKDAGYVVKNFDEKGWGLFNLQTQAVIMNSNPPVEKKNLEITGIKKTDDFSLLLSNAVNDTAVLYTVNKPKKIIAAPDVAVVEEKKKDTIVIAPKEIAPVKEIPPAKDTVAFVKPEPVKKDTNVTAKIIAKPEQADTTSVTKTTPPVVKNPDAVDSTSVSKNIAPVINEPVSEKNQDKHDTAVVAKNATPPTTNTDSPGAIPKITNSIKNLFGIGKTETKPRKDTIIIIDTNAAAKNTERKDAIILMPGAGEEKNISKNTAAPNENKPRAPIKNDTTTVAKSGIIGASKDSSINEPVKKHRPAIAKTAELFTDTSYVAVFIDGSKGNTDTIRISIPFKEAAATVARNKPTIKEAKPADNIDKIKKDSPVVIAEQPVTVTKKDTTAATITDSGKNAKAAPTSINSDCKEAAFDIDIDKLRIKMMQAVSDEEKITLAKKVYRLKCFSVKQVRALSEIFKTDEGKYRWFDAVYPFVSDNNNFSSLAELIKNEYYLSRFKAMLRN